MPIGGRGRLTLPLAGPLALYLLGALIAALTSYNPSVCLGWLASLGAGAALYAAIVLRARGWGELRLAAGALVIVAALAALLIALQYRHLQWEAKFGPATALGRVLSSPFPAVSSPWLTSNAAAALLEGPLAVALGLVIATRGRARLVWAGCAALIGLGVLLSASRGAWAALAVAGLVAALARLRIRADAQALRPSRRQIYLAGGGALAIGAAALLAAVLFPQALGSALLRAIDRLELYRNSFYLALDTPFTGVGGGGQAFAMTYARLQLLILVPYLTYAHNLFLSVWLAHGLLGLLGFGGLLIASARLVWRALLTLGPVGLGAALGCLANLLHGITDAPQYDLWPVLLMAFALFGILVAAARLADPAPLRWIRPGRRGWLAFGAAMLLALGLLGPGLAARAVANAATLLHMRALLSPEVQDPGTRQALLDIALLWTENGLRIAPGSPAVLKAHGLIDMSSERYDVAIVALERAAPAYPDDQAVRKALGYAYIWYGYTDEGVRLLRSLDRADEVRGELNTWQIARRERGQLELAERARAAAQAWDAARALSLGGR